MTLESTVISSNVFLLHPENRAYVKGEGPQVTNASTTGCLAMFVVAFLGLGLIFVLMAARDVVQWWMIEANSVVTSGAFVERWVAVSDSNTQHYVSFRYRHNAVDYQAEQRIDKSIYDRAAAGTSVEVHVVPDNPTVATLAGTNQFPLGISLMALLWNTAVLGFTRRVWRQHRRQRQLERCGILLEGIVTHCRVKKNADGDYLLDIEYCFTPPDAAASISGREHVVRNDLVHNYPPKVGSVVQILYAHPLNYLLL